MHVLALLCVVASALPGDDANSWASFRNGGLCTTDSQRLPLTWSPSEGIAWQVELPGYGQSAAIAWGDKVYVTAVEGSHKQTGLLIALDHRTGHERWRVMAPAKSHRLPSNYAVARAAPTPCADADGVYAFFEAGEVLAVTHQGEQRWLKSLTEMYGEFDNNHGLGSSPAQSETQVFLNIQHGGPSYLLSVSKATGDVSWKVERKSAKCWSSPIVLKHQGEAEVLVSAAGTLQAYRAVDGTPTWSIDGLSGNTVASPVIAGDRLMIGASQGDFDAAGSAARSNMCLTRSAAGGFEVAWRSEKAMCDYASPVVAGDYVYLMNRSSVLNCLDRQTGREVYAKRMGSHCWSTPIVAGDRVYFFAKNGETTVLAVGGEYRELAVNSLWDPLQPPQPESYRETTGGHGHEAGGGAAGGGRRERGGGMAALLLKSDKNEDGRVDKDEIPEQLAKALESGDTNGDGALDQAEINILAEEFRKRREASQSDGRDPIVYAASVADDTLLVRTGTRLYCVGAVPAESRGQ